MTLLFLRCQGPQFPLQAEILFFAWSWGMSTESTRLWKVQIVTPWGTWPGDWGKRTLSPNEFSAMDLALEFSSLLCHWSNSPHQCDISYDCSKRQNYSLSPSPLSSCKLFCTCSINYSLGCLWGEVLARWSSSVAILVLPIFHLPVYWFEFFLVFHFLVCIVAYL